MSCAITSGKTRGCRTGFGGIVAFTAFALEDLDEYTVTGGDVSAISLNSGKQAYKYELEDESGSFTQPFVGSRQAGTFVVTQTLTAPFTDFATATRLQLETLAKNRFVVIAHMADGTHRISGLDAGHMIDSGDAGSGTVHEDMNGVNFVSTVKESHFAYNISTALADSLLIAAS